MTPRLTDTKLALKARINALRIELDNLANAIAILNVTPGTYVQRRKKRLEFKQRRAELIRLRKKLNK